MRGNRRKRRRFLAFLLASVLFVPQSSAVAFAKGNASGGLCEHHPEHIGCSYREAVLGHSCGHKKHTEECYTDELICRFMDDMTADDSRAEDISAATDSNLPKPHEHGPKCYRLDCPHERGEHTGGVDSRNVSAECGYTEAISAEACDYHCSVCSEKNDVITITEFDELNEEVRHQEVLLNTPQADLNLPGKLKARAFTGEEREKDILIRDVTWKLIEKNGSLTVYDEEETRSCIYYYQAVLPEQYQTDEGVALPEIEVWYGLAGRRQLSRSNDPYKSQNEALCNYINTYSTPKNCAEYDPDAGCVKLLKDAAMNYIYIPAGDSKSGSTLDLNGHTLTKESGYAVYLYGGDFTLIDSEGGGELIAGNVGRNAAILVLNGSNLTIKGAAVAGYGKQLSEVPGVMVYSGQNYLTVEDCEITGGLQIRPQSVLIVEGGLTTDYLLGAPTIHIRNGQTLDLSNLSRQKLQGTQDREIVLLSDGGEPDTATPLIKVAKDASDLYFEWSNSPAGYELSSSLEGNNLIYVMKEKLPNFLKVKCTLPEHVKVQLVPGEVERGKDYSIALEPEPGYVVKDGNITVKQWVGGGWSKRAHSYDQGTNILKVENVQNELQIVILENIQLTYDSNPAGGSIKVYGKNDFLIGADKLVAPNAQVRIVAEPEEGYSLNKILFNGAAVKNNTTLTITEPSRIEAEFIKAVILPDPPEILQQDVPATTIFAGYQYMISASGSPPLSWSVSNEEGNRLPEGLTLNPDTGTIYGMPVVSGTFDFIVTVRDAAGNTDSRKLSILIREPSDVIHVTSVELSRQTLSLTVGNTASLTAKILPDNAYNKKVTWQSDDPDTAKVDQNGLVTAVKSGTANITVTTEDGGKMDTCAVTVDEIHVTSVELSRQTLSLTVGNTASLTAKILPDNAYNKKITWQSDNPDTAVIDQSGLVTAMKSGTANITVTTEDGGKTDTCVVTVTGGHSVSGGRGGGSSVSTGQASRQNAPELAAVELAVTSGSAIITADDTATLAALSAAENAARQKGRASYGLALQYNLRSEAVFDGFSVTIKREVLDRFITKGLKWMTIHTDTVDLTFDLAALKVIAAGTSGDITLTAAREPNLTGGMLQAVGTRPAYRLTVGYVGEDGRPATITDFGAGRVTVGIAYSPDGAEQTGGLYLIHGDNNGGVEWFTWSGLNRDGKGVSGTTGHFSLFGVGYRPAAAFTDTVNHLYQADMDFAVSRGLMSGTAPEEIGRAARFEPDSAVTRSMLVTALGRLNGVNPADYPSSGKFKDVPSDTAYGPYAEWAAGAGIITNAAEAYFNPDASVTRGQMALILKQYADSRGYELPLYLEAKTFSDNSQISSAAVRDAVRVMQQAGIMESKNNGSFAPNEAVSRAEAAGILRRFLEAVVGSAKVQKS